ncbi:MAG: energy transducer TonB, partial [Acidobacteria bacterium]|nr:energy transducer TonB [Acidobacteriota bacterium]
KAIEAVERWRFRPALRNGRPVRAPALVEVHFHLL